MENYQKSSCFCVCRGEKGHEETFLGAVYVLYFEGVW